MQGRQRKGSWVFRLPSSPCRIDTYRRKLIECILLYLTETYMSEVGYIMQRKNGLVHMAGASMPDLKLRLYAA